jgi:hypothetical protein
VSYEDLKSGDYVYPPWSISVGWVLTASSLVCIPAYILYFLAKTPGTFKEVIIWSKSTFFCLCTKRVSPPSLKSNQLLLIDKIGKFHLKILISTKHTLYSHISIILFYSSVWFLFQRLRKAITPQQDSVDPAITLNSNYGTHVWLSGVLPKHNQSYLEPVSRIKSSFGEWLVWRRFTRSMMGLW